MAQITAWKCDITGKVFTDKKMYVAHLRKYARELRYTSAQEARLAVLDAKLAALQAEEFSINDLAAKLMENEQLLWDAVVSRPNSQSYRRDMLKRMKDVTWRPKLASVKFRNMRRDGFIDTGGDAPKGQLATYIRPEYGQHGRAISRGYPGWQGYVDIEVQTHAKMQGWYLSSEWLNAIRIYTGTGGGGGSPKTDIQRFSYSVSIFEDDWTGMKRVYEKERMMNILKGEND